MLRRHSGLAAFVVLLGACGGAGVDAPPISTPVLPKEPLGGPPKAEITRILDSIRAASNLPALAGAIVTRDSTYAVDAVGFRRAGGTTPVTINDKFHLGSNLKAMTSGWIGLLVDAGRLQWTTTIAAAFPELAGSMRSEYRSLTVRELLSHQSGIIRDPTVSFTEATPRLQRESLVRWVVQQPLATARGTYSYSNTGYMVAAAIAERLLDRDFETAIVDQLFRPLGMLSVGFGAPGNIGVEDQPWGHGIDANGTRVPVSPGPSSDNPPVYSPAGRAHMSIGDWATWIRAVLRAESGATTQWTSATAKMLTQPAVTVGGADGYALGWVTTQRSWATPTLRVLFHDGTNTINYSVAWLAADGGFAVIAVTNQGGVAAASALDVTAGRLLNLYRNGR